MIGSLAPQGIIAVAGGPQVPYFDPGNLEYNSGIHKFWWHYNATGYTKQGTSLPSADAGVGDNVGMLLGLPGSAGSGGVSNVGLVKQYATPMVVAEDGVDMPTGIFYETGTETTDIRSDGITIGYRARRVTAGNSAFVVLFAGIDWSPRAVFVDQVDNRIRGGASDGGGQYSYYEMVPTTTGFQNFHSVILTISPGPSSGKVVHKLYVDRVLVAEQASEYTPSYYTTTQDRLYNGQTGKTWRLQSRLLIGQDITDAGDIDNLFNFLEYGAG